MDRFNKRIKLANLMLLLVKQATLFTVRRLQFVHKKTPGVKLNLRAE